MIDKKSRSNRNESDHAAMKPLFGYRQSFQSLKSAKTTLSGIETIRTIKRGYIQNRNPGIRGEIQFISQLFEIA
ncbi:DDE-type integrase/transposase/recombinase [Roseibium porphyridii]|uniref:DDE-type integrase/transposase/recombinase n=1 Tax=Roseibium porphyridii TaxID=2866279 RepID=A0ABY8F903_9HYPH|nr:DDE-type integrase/transposase/recombinase [Roseibium sp. KMA01]WFE89148.1 DDE-type integrase/transposase/recombinase [Roseibium sp. KMA01]